MRPSSVTWMTDSPLVIDPIETRDWLLRGLSSAPPESLQRGLRPFVDTW